MESNLHLDLSRNKERLEYYTRLKNTGRGPSIQKWIEIYQERITHLEKQAVKLAKKAAAAAQEAAAPPVTSKASPKTSKASKAARSRMH